MAKTAGVATSGSVTIKKIFWKIPHISVDDSERLKLMKIVEKEKSYLFPLDHLKCMNIRN